MNKKKFTLIELIVTIVVMSILLAIVLVQLQNIKDKSVTSYMKANTKEIQTAVDRYYLKNERYPIINSSDITLENPQYIDVELLAKDGYFKKEINLNKITNQHYKLDVFGRVWGASEPSLANTMLANTMLASKEGSTSNEYFVDVPKELNSLIIYEVKNGRLITAEELQRNSYFASTNKSSNNKITVNEVNEIKISKNTMVSISIENNESVYLFGGVDKFGLEIAPTGIGYEPYSFKPIRGGEGEYEYKLEGYNLKEWVDFITQQETPNGSKIEYQFATKDSLKGSYGEWRNDFPYNEKAYGIKVKITMSRGDDGSKPSLLSLNIVFKTEGKDIKKPELMSSPDIEDWSSGGYGEPIVNPSNPLTNELQVNENTCPINDFNVPNKFTYYYKLDKDNIVDSISINHSKNNVYLHQYLNGSYVSVGSFADILKGNCFSVTLVPIDDISVEITNPIVHEIPENEAKKDRERIILENPTQTISGDSTEDLTKPKEGIPTEAPSSDKEVYSEKWTTIDDIRFFQQGLSSSTIWNGYETGEIVEKDKTRILYRFATGSGINWTSESVIFPAGESSHALMVHAYLQVHNDYIDDSNVADPKLNWIKIKSSDGDFYLDTLKPTMFIYAQKNNNTGRSTISNESEIVWKYEAEDPNNFDIVNVEWNPTLNTPFIKYSNAGKNSIKGRVQNSEGVWSNWTTFAFDVLPEKPVAKFKLNDGKDYIYAEENVLFDTSESVDPDGDKIVEYEWKNKKDIYSKEEIGQIVISLRVKDSEGYWSDWYDKTIHIVNPNSIWLVNGLPAEVGGYASSFDGDRNTHHFGDFIGFQVDVSWKGDLSGKTMSTSLNVFNTDAKIRFFDKNNNELYHLTNDHKYSNVSNFNYNLVNLKLIIPEGAVKMNITSVRKILDIHIVEGKGTLEGISNLTFNSSQYSQSASWTKPSRIVNTYFIVDNKILTYSNGTSAVIKGLSPNKKYDYKIISVDSDFIASEVISKSVTTENAEVSFSGVSTAVFDKNDTSNNGVSSGTIVWNGDISGRTIEVFFRADYGMSYYFSDKNGNRLYHLTNRNEYVMDGKVNWNDAVTIRMIVPENAVSFTFDKVYAINGFHLVDKNEQINNITNLSVVSEEYSISLNWNKTPEIVRTYFISSDNIMYSTTGNSLKISSLKPNQTLDYKIISVDSKFNASTIMNKKITTKDAITTFSGVDNVVMDKTNTTSTYLGVYAYAAITWDKDIAGRKIYINSSSGMFDGTQVYFKDANGNIVKHNSYKGQNLDKSISTQYFNGTVTVPTGAVSMHFEKMNYLINMYIVD